MTRASARNTKALRVRFWQEADIRHCGNVCFCFRPQDVTMSASIQVFWQPH
jgi:hypothetical protein